ncbi:MAG TPA: toll/interleukin-1 receptor domain-containing protein [Lamprocystis sp. (in: g-proteobacteria)]|nr:toll/interleukin-1 receptor domain-containing protein [Lamprocystis sp. (in: g-proteobacteria)]
MDKSRFVFISHSSEDTWVARQIADKIRSAGAKSFLDEDDLDIVDEPDEKIREALKETDELLVLITPWALTRPYVWVEIGVAWSRELPFVVVLHGLQRQEFLARPEAPTFLKAKNFIRLNEIDRYFNELDHRVRGESGNG